MLAPAGVFGRLTAHQSALDAFLHEQLAEFEPEIRDLAAYSLEASGKRLRPALVFLSGWKGPGAPSAELVRVAAVVEMVHLATLVHDDIMDGAEVRRNRPTVARRYGSAAAVLLGDALFAHALHLTTQFQTTAVCAAVSVAMRRVCAGEIVQTLRRGSLRVDRADYTRIVDLKTAELFRVSCQWRAIRRPLWRPRATLAGIWASGIRFTMISWISLERRRESARRSAPTSPAAS